jgi:hypothetical protein
MALIPSLMGVLAQQISLEVIPLCLLAVYAGLLGLYLLTTRPRSALTAPAARIEKEEPRNA